MMACDLAEETVSIDFGAKTLPGVLDWKRNSGPFRRALILNHGAGGDCGHPQLEMVAHGLAAEGFVVLRFTCKSLNIDYRAKAFGCALDYLVTRHKEIKNIIIGGRSMGARAAAILGSRTANQLPCQEASLQKISGVLCLAYPLNVKGLPITPVRLNPLIKLKVPLIFIAGTEDSLCQRYDLERVIRTMACPVEVEWIPDCGHDLESKECPFDQVMPSVIKWCLKRVDP